MSEAVIIVAGGSGSRMKSEIPKQFLLIHNKPVLWYTLQCFYRCNPEMTIVLVLPENQQDYWKELCATHHCEIPHTLVTGGETRFHSVKNGLDALTEEKIIGIHDGVRPLVSIETITNCFRKARELKAVIPVIDVFETLRKTAGENSETVPRSEYCLVQTPQVFERKILFEAYKTPYLDKFTDDASVLEQAGNRISLVSGNRENIKITTPSDLKIAEALLGNQTY